MFMNKQNRFKLVLVLIRDKSRLVNFRRERKIDLFIKSIMKSAKYFHPQAGKTC